MTQPIVTKTQPTFYFIGVTTGKSSIRKIFPKWMEVLGRPEVVLEGVDLKIHDEPENYRRVVTQIKEDPLSLGALVTTHKIDLVTAARPVRLSGPQRADHRRGVQHLQARRPAGRARL
mgnify:CR=1 FL=1